MRFEYLEYLVEIYQCLSISKAAENLYVSQPALSSALGNLEKQLGFNIFKRSNLGVSPTANGLEVIKGAKRILEIYNSWHTLSAPKDKTLSGIIRVGANPSLCTTFMVNILSQLKIDCPLLEVRVNEIKPPFIFKHLQEHKSDIILCSIPESNCLQIIEQIERMGMSCRPLLAEKLRLVMSSFHPLAHKKILNKDDLATMTFATYVDDGDVITSAINKIIPAHCHKYRVSSNSMIWTMVSTNMAAAIGPILPILSIQYADIGQFTFADIENFDNVCVHFLISPAPANMGATEKSSWKQLSSYILNISRVLSLEI